MFATGLSALPPMGLDEKITIYYREDTCPHFFAEPCTMELKVPTVHDQYSKFYNSFSGSLHAQCSWVWLYVKSSNKTMGQKAVYMYMFIC